MNTVVFIAAGTALVFFGLLCIRTADAINMYRANRKSEASALSKRQHDAAVAAQSKILREALFLLGGKK